ncbi:MAG: hypothetical protein JST21_06475 [Bacteroidetes bacterium]|nr:hypothetical protein [Bacteroidota bacterium]
MLCFKSVCAQQYQFRTYSFNNGLSSYNAGKIIQDKYGFIWVATQEGINRFDGKNFITVKKDPVGNTGLSENYVTDMAPDKNGKLWIATALGGIDVFETGSLTVEKRYNAVSNHLITNWIRCLAWDYQGNDLWIGTYYGFNVLDKKTNQSIAVTENPFNKKHDFNICSIALDSFRNMLIVAEGEGVLIYNGETKKLISKISKEELKINANSTFSVKNIFIDASRKIYLCSDKGIKCIETDGKNYHASENADSRFKAFENEDIRGIMYGRKGELWLATANGIKVIDSNEEVNTVQHSNFFSNTILDDNINYLFKDRFGNIWVSTTKGLNHLINEEFEFYAFNAKAGDLSKIQSVNVLFADNDSVIYACAASGLFKINIRTNSETKILDSKVYGEIETVMRIDKNGLLVSSNQKLLYLKQDGVQFKVSDAAAVFKELAPIQYYYFSTCMKYNDSIFLMGSMDEEGFVKWDIKNHSVKTFLKKEGDNNAPYENSYHNIRKDKFGNVWLLSDNSITLFDPLTDAFHNYFPGNTHQSPPHFFFDIFNDGRYLWISSYGYGLIRFDIQNDSCLYFTQLDGLSSNATYNILNENDSIIWISSNKGLTRFNFISNKTSVYYEDDGLQSNAFDERSGCVIGDELFFGGIDGFTKISRNNQFIASSKMPVYLGKIDYVDVKGKTVTINTLEAARLFFKTFPITFYIISPEYSNNSRISYAYRIEELNNDWVTIGNNNQITFAGLPPGTYHFQGKVENLYNDDNLSAVVEFTILPRWYQTWWFYVLMALIISGILYAFYRYRIAQIKLQQQQLKKVREEIASDLHDDIGSTLNGLKIFTHLAENATDKQPYFLRIEDSLKNMSEGIRDMIWVLDDKHDNASNLMARIEKLTRPVADAKGINISFMVQRDIVLDKKVKRNLLMIAKEAINNSIKYSGCKNIAVHFDVSEYFVIMVLKDDGQGFIEEMITPGEGLRNMKMRAEQIAYQLTLRSSECGTTITLQSK